MIIRSLILLALLFSSEVFAATAVSETGIPLTNCGGGVWRSGPCPYVPVGNCDGTQGTAVAIPMNFHLPQNTGRYVAMSGVSDDLTYNTHSGSDPSINWSTRFRQFEVGTPGSRFEVGEKAFDEWVIETLPTNGTLWEGDTQIVSADHTVYDPSSIWYKANAAYTGADSFTYCGIDSTGRTNIAAVNLTVENPASYSLPIGFPAVTFGINKTPPADPVEWPTAANANSYYVDSDDPGCSDATNGYPNQPRCNIPDSGTVIAAGSKIVLAASTLPYRLRASVSWHQLDLNGSSGSEVWIVGDSDDAVKPKISLGAGRSDGTLRLLGSHVIIDGVDFDGVSIQHRDNLDTHVTLRNSIIQNSPAVVGSPFTFKDGLNNILALNNTFRNNGRIEEDLVDENDVHGINVLYDQNFHVLDHFSHNNAGDTFQIGNNGTSDGVYIGRVVSHSDMENCFDFKTFTNALVTESDCYDLRNVSYFTGSGGFGQAFYVNDEGPQAGYSYFLNNRCWDVMGTCFGTASIDNSKVYFLNNVSLYNPAAECYYSGTGSGERHFSLNTCANVARGLNVFTSGPVGTINERLYVGNLFYNTTEYDFSAFATYANITKMDYNFTTSNPGVYKYGSSSTPTTAANLADFVTQTSTCANCAENQTVTFTNAALLDFSITAGSIVDAVPASIFGVGSGLEDALVDLNADLGVTLTDLLGVVRPQNTNYDAGAYEVP